MCSRDRIDPKFKKHHVTLTMQPYGQKLCQEFGFFNDRNRDAIKEKLWFQMCCTNPLTSAQVSFDDMNIFRSVTNDKIVHIERTRNTRRYSLSTELIFNPNRETERMLSCDMPFPGQIGVNGKCQNMLGIFDLLKSSMPNFHVLS